MAVFDQQKDGMKLISHLPGNCSSSTRMELAGAIVAVVAPGPIHLATDSKAFLDKAKSVHQLVEQQRQPRRPWALQTDGDLWKHYYDQVQAEGHGSMRITNKG